jgi:hypothetical protein
MILPLAAMPQAWCLAVSTTLESQTLVRHGRLRSLRRRIVPRGTIYVWNGEFLVDSDYLFVPYQRTYIVSTK